MLFLASSCVLSKCFRWETEAVVPLIQNEKIGSVLSHRPLFESGHVGRLEGNCVLLKTDLKIF